MITLWSEWRYSVFTRAVYTSEADCDMIFGVSCPGLELIHNSLPSDQRRTLATEISDETEENLMFICLIVSPNFSLSDRSPWPPGLVSMSCVITPANYTPLCWVYMVSNYGEYLWWAFMMRIYGEYSWWVSHDPPYYGQAWEVHGASMNVPSVSLTWYFSASYSISLHLSQCRALVPVFNIWQFLPDAEGALVLVPSPCPTGLVAARGSEESAMSILLSNSKYLFPPRRPEWGSVLSVLCWYSRVNTGPQTWCVGHLLWLPPFQIKQKLRHKQ